MLIDAQCSSSSIDVCDAQHAAHDKVRPRAPNESGGENQTHGNRDRTVTKPQPSHGIRNLCMGGGSIAIWSGRIDLIAVHP